MLPIGVVLPTFNSMAYLEDHVRGMEPWLDLVEQVVVVDSHSSDGTPEFLRSRLRHPRIEIVQHPPGLYESWNFGIGRIGATYTYISTVGDSIEREGLQHLARTAESLQCDVVVSPPRIVDSRGRPAPGRSWPVHELVDRLGITEPVTLDRRYAFSYAVFFGMWLRAILGSSASDLFRTAVLQERPFPTDRCSVGDTFWGVLHAMEVDLAITPRVCATFRMHPAPHRRRDQASRRVLHESLVRESRTSLRRSGAAGRASHEEEVFALLDRCLDAQEDLRRVDTALRAYRRRHPLWFLRREAWRIRSTRNFALDRLTHVRRDLDGRAHSALRRSAARTSTQAPTTRGPEPGGRSDGVGAGRA